MKITKCPPHCGDEKPFTPEGLDQGVLFERLFMGQWQLCVTTDEDDWPYLNLDTGELACGEGWNHTYRPFTGKVTLEND